MGRFHSFITDGHTYLYCDGTLCLKVRHTHKGQRHVTLFYLKSGWGFAHMTERLYDGREDELRAKIAELSELAVTASAAHRKALADLREAQSELQEIFRLRQPKKRRGPGHGKASLGG